MNSISHNLKNLRKSRGWTQQQMADKLSVTHQTVSNWESGRSMPDIDTLNEIAAKLDTDINYLLYGKKGDNSRLKKEIAKTVGILLVIWIMKERIGLVTFAIYNKGIYPHQEIVAWYYNIPFTAYRLISPFSYIFSGVLAGQLLKYSGQISLNKNNSFYRYSSIIAKIYTAFYLACRLLSDILHTYTKVYKKLPEIIIDLYRKPFNFYINHFRLFAIMGFVLEMSKPFTDNKISLPAYSPGRTNTIARNIKQLRLDASLTQQQLADKLFVTRQTISNWENGVSQS